MELSLPVWHLPTFRGYRKFRW